MKTLNLLVCLLLVAPLASAGGVVLVLPEGASLVDVSAPNNATVSSSLTAGHVVVSATGPNPGAVIVTAQLNGSSLVVADYLPADHQNLAPIQQAQAAILARINALEAQADAIAENASQNGRNTSQNVQQLRSDALSHFAALSGELAGLEERMVDLQNGTATVSGQVADLDSDVQAIAEEEPPKDDHGGIGFLIFLVLVGVAAQEARFWWLRSRTAEAEPYEDDATDGLSFTDAEE